MACARICSVDRHTTRVGSMLYTHLPLAFACRAEAERPRARAKYLDLRQHGPHGHIQLLAVPLPHQIVCVRVAREREREGWGV